MKQRITLVFILCMVFLAACGNHSEPATVTAVSASPGSAPDATPSVQPQPEADGMPGSETGQDQPRHYESYEDLIRSTYAVDGNYYGNESELQMFRKLPQDEPYPFVVRTFAMLQGADTVEDHIVLAQKFVELGCEAKVKEMRGIEDGTEYRAWVTIITTTPSHFWDINSSLDEKLHVEQLYKSVDNRFDAVVWPEN